VALEDVGGALLEDAVDLGARRAEDDGVAVNRDAFPEQVERGAVLATRRLCSPTRRTRGP
jgi:hypothetical protein